MASGSLDLNYRWLCVMTCGCKELNPDPLQEQQVLLFTESPQTQRFKYECVSVWRYVHAGTYRVQKRDLDIGYPVTGVRGSCKLPGVNAGNSTRVLFKSNVSPSQDHTLKTKSSQVVVVHPCL